MYFNLLQSVVLVFCVMQLWQSSTKQRCKVATNTENVRQSPKKSSCGDFGMFGSKLARVTCYLNLRFYKKRIKPFIS